MGRRSNGLSDLWAVGIKHAPKVVTFQSFKIVTIGKC